MLCILSDETFKCLSVAMQTVALSIIFRTYWVAKQSEATLSLMLVNFAISLIFIVLNAVLRAER